MTKEDLEKMAREDCKNINHMQILKHDIEIGRYSFQHGIPEAITKYGIDSKGVATKRAIYRGYSKLENLIPDLGKKAENKNIKLTSCCCRTASSFTDDALKDAADALLSGGRISRTNGIIWPDGRKRPVKDCRKKRNRSKGKTEPVRAPKRPEEELAELIAGAAGTFDASIERYVSDYPDASKEKATRELQKAEEILAAWIEKLTLNE